MRAWPRQTSFPRVKSEKHCTLECWASLFFENSLSTLDYFLSKRNVKSSATILAIVHFTHALAEEAMSHLYDQNLHPSSIVQHLHETSDGEDHVPRPTTSAVLHRDLHKKPYQVVQASGLYLTLSNGKRIIDATGGAAVSCIGHGNERVRDAIHAQITKLDYCHSLFFSCPPSEELSRTLIDSTAGLMSKAFIVNSGKRPL